MGSAFSWVLIVLGGVTLFAILLAVLAFLSYRRLSVTIKPISAFPEFKFKLASMIGSVVSFIARNFVSAAGGFVSGVKLNGQVIIQNHSFIPLYFPAIEHQVSIGGKSCLNTVCTRSLWLKPGASVTLPVTLTVGTSDIPDVALDGLTHGGAIAVEVTSRMNLGSISLLKITRVSVNRPRALPKPARAVKTPAIKRGSRREERGKKGMGESKLVAG
jgi:hypothetical protein